MEGRYLIQHGIICTQTHTCTCSSVSLHYSYIMSSNINYGYLPRCTIITCKCTCTTHVTCTYCMYMSVDFIPLQVLLHRSMGEEGKFLSVKSSEYDQDLFLLSWGPTVAALSYVFDKADEKSIVQRAIDGFRYIRWKKSLVGVKYLSKSMLEHKRGGLLSRLP